MGVDGFRFNVTSILNQHQDTGFLGFSKSSLGITAEAKTEEC
jgi:pullulanase/glycogen debranching enzyme|tara:strand:+ start:1279 stop:1404 length:126 start_codon:yes stop_codon:yes gene_type:complete